jgi:hypothetical protein
MSQYPRVDRVSIQSRLVCRVWLDANTPADIEIPMGIDLARPLAPVLDEQIARIASTPCVLCEKPAYSKRWGEYACGNCQEHRSEELRAIWQKTDPTPSAPCRECGRLTHERYEGIPACIWCQSNPVACVSLAIAARESKVSA